MPSAKDYLNRLLGTTDSTPTTNAIPEVPNTADSGMYAFLRAVKDWIGQSTGANRLLTWRDLMGAGLATTDETGAVVGAVPGMIYTPPPAPTNLTAVGAMTHILVEWDGVTYGNHAFTEIYANGTDDLGTAVLVGTVHAGVIFAHSVGTAQSRYYWVRFVSQANIAGPWNAANGVLGETSQDPSWLLDVLTGELTESNLSSDLNSRIDLIDGPSIDPGTVNFRVVDLENRERRDRISQVESNAEAALRAVLAVNDARVYAADTVAIATRDMQQAIVEGVSAEASERLTLAAKLDTDIGTTVALIVDEATARATADTAEATARELLRVTLEGADTAITALVSDESAARVSGDAAEAYQRSLLQASLEADDDVLTARIYAEETTRATADTALAQQITLLSAGSGEQFDWQAIWYFDAGIESWSGNGTPTASNGFIRPADQASSAYVYSPTGMATDAAKYGQVRLRARKTGTVTFAGWLWWREAADSTWDTGRRVALTEPTWDANDIGLITVTPEWTGTIDRIRIDLSDAQTATDYMEIDWVAVGRPSPGASSAQLLVEQTARIDADSALTTSYTTLNAQVNHVTTGLPAAHAAVVTEASARASADSALTTSFNTLNAQVNHATTGLPAAFAAIDDEATARASAIDAEAATRELLAARVTDAEADIVTNAASIVTEQTARADEDTALANSITALQAVVTDAEADIIQTQADLQSEQTVRATADDANATDVRRLRAKTEDADETALRNLLIGEAIRTDMIGTIALAQHELQTDIVAGLSAEATARLDLQAMVNTNAAAIVSEQTARADADSSLASDITTLAASVADVETGLAATSAILADEQIVRADADSALASDITTVEARLNSGGDISSAIVTAQTTATTGVNNAATAQSTANTALSNASTAQSTANTAVTNAATANAALADIASDSLLTPDEKPRVIQDRDVIVAEQSGIDAEADRFSVSRAAYDTAVSALTTYLATLTTPVLWSSLSGNTTIVGATFRAKFADVYTTRQVLLNAIAAASKSLADTAQAAADAAQSDVDTVASSVTTLQTTVGGHTTSIATNASSINGIEAKYTVKIDNNGYVTGYGLISTDNNGTPTSEFAVVANKFSIAATDGSSDSAPFFHLTNDTVIGGVTVPAGTYMQAAFIHDASITTAKIADLAVDNAKIATVAAAKIAAGSIDVGNYIQSSNYSAGSAGWRIHGDGTAEISEAIVRGTVYATDGEFSGKVTVGAGSSVPYSFVTSGPPSNADQTLSALNAGTSITGGGITLSGGGSIKGGQTAYATGTGFFLGYESGAYKFSVGSTSDYINFSGTTLSIGVTSLYLNASDASRLSIVADGSSWNGALKITADWKSNFLGRPPMSPIQINCAYSSSNTMSGVGVDVEITPFDANSRPYCAYFKIDDSTHKAGAPLVLVPSSSSSAPTHSALLGSLWVTSTGVLYINTSGSTTWQKVGAQ